MYLQGPLPAGKFVVELQRSVTSYKNNSITSSIRIVLLGRRNIFKEILEKWRGNVYNMVISYFWLEEVSLASVIYAKLPWECVVVVFFISTCS